MSTLFLPSGFSLLVGYHIRSFCPFQSMLLYPSSADGVDNVSHSLMRKDSYPYYLRPYQHDEYDEIVKGLGYGFYVTRRGSNPKTRSSSTSHSKVSRQIKEDELGQNSISSPSLFPNHQGTTWLKCLTYSDLSKEETKSIDALVDILKKQSIFNSDDDDYISKVRLTGGFDHGEWAFSVGPVLQLISVTISTPSTSKISIHGEISLPHSPKRNFSIFKREPHDPLLLDPRQQLNYLPLADSLVLPVIGGRVKFSITNGVDDSQILDGYCHVDDSVDDSKEGKSTLQFLGKDDFRATMEFIKIPFALVAKVSLFLIYTPPSTCTVSRDESFKVHGKILVNKVTCFDKKYEEGVPIVPGEEYSFFPSRRVFAVPVCSPLVFEVNLFRGGLNVLDDTIKVHPDSNAEDGIPASWKVRIQCQEVDYTFVMHLKWIHYNEFFSDELADVEVPSVDQTPAAADEVLELDPPLMQTDTFPWVKIHPTAGISDDNFWANYLERMTPPPVTSSDYVEVFSVFIGGGSLSTPPALVGLIGIRDEDGTVYVFYRNANLPDKLSNVQFRNLSLAWPGDRCILEESFFMFLDLKDDEGRQVCRGSLRLDGYGSIPTRYEARVCNVIPSKDRSYFAAVHCSIFKNGKQAKVSVEWNGEEDILVYGSVVAQYSNYTYPSAYEKEFYRSIIFKRSKEDAASVKKSSRIQLSKSVVATPSDCAGLTIHVDLKYYANEHDLISSVTGNNLEFKAGETKFEICQGIIKLTVEWLPS